ncbi:tetratricopeptide repeat protein [Chloroflexota bacterium]
MSESERDSSSAAERARWLLNRGAHLLAQNKAPQAVPVLEEALRLDGQSVPVLINMGGAYIVTGQHKRAIPLLEEAGAAEPDNAMVWINLGAAYLGHPVLASSSEQMNAIKAFERALELDPAAPSVHYNLGLIYVDRGDTDSAVEAFRQAIKFGPRDRDAHILLRKFEPKSDLWGDT